MCVIVIVVTHMYTTHSTLFVCNHTRGISGHERVRVRDSGGKSLFTNTYTHTSKHVLVQCMETRPQQHRVHSERSFSATGDQQCTHKVMRDCQRSWSKHLFEFHKRQCEGIKNVIFLNIHGFIFLFLMIKNNETGDKSPNSRLENDSRNRENTARRFKNKKYVLLF